jgi:hypothetical protein
MTGQQLCDAARDGDAAKVSTLLAVHGAQFFINYQDEHGSTPLHIAAAKGLEAVTKQLITARCNVDLQTHHGFTHHGCLISLWQTSSTYMGAQIPAIAEKPLATCGCRTFQLDPFGDHLNTCTAHSGVKTVHDWMVDQVPDFFRTTHKVKTQDVVKSRGQTCGDIELSGYLANAAGMGSSTDPSLNGHLKYPNNLDQSLNDATADKIRKYRADYNNRPPSAVSFIPSIASTSGRLHSEFVRLLFLQDHRETDRFFVSSGVQFAQTHPGGQFTFRRAAFLTQLQSKVGLALVKAEVLRVNLNLDGAPIVSKSHTHP